ncbi:MAG TPA: lanthionine synthetase LanC family protein [Tahibacter sp.]|uniref:lanthionine synthetase LanC family protein n=1 Tax=Tahibacter sp. TaxID=2056211 RepID=UPI002B99EB5D|nr:lanthionine synthetase LanC family protein [Tahibacter sp.]HSX59223.1 lanthionine synthetase LanC family protein [Tahibacter sp.]
MNARLAAAPAAAPPLPAPGSRYLDVADAIGCRLVRDAIWSGNSCNWQIWTKEPIGGAFHAVYRAGPADVYLGSAGIALFLAQLVRCTGDAQQRHALHGAVQQVRRRLAQRKRETFGFYNGSSGAAWTLAAVGALEQRPDWIAEGLDVLRRLPDEAALADQHDLISGKAGLAIALLGAGERFGDEELIALGARVAGALAAEAQTGQGGSAWPNPERSGPPLLGLSHGVSGMALALLEADRLRPDRRCRDTAMAALRYERRAYDTTQRNWPDYRPLPGVPNAAPRFPVAWCHGSTGIGMARLRLLELLPDDDQALGEIDVAVANAVQSLNVPMQPLVTDFTLCHGATGNNDLLLSVAARFGRTDALAAAQRVGDVMRELVHANQLPWGCGVPDCGDSVSLLTGSAGIGLHFLRLHDCAAVPSPLYPCLPRDALPAAPASRPASSLPH